MPPEQPTAPVNAPVQKNVLMGVLSYIGPLIIVSYLSAKDDPFVKFHIKQGLVLFVVEVAVWFFSTFMAPLWFLLQFVNFIVLVLAIVGIVNASKGVEKELPLVGHFSNQFNF